MARSTRGAAQRARELIARGFRLKDYEETDMEPLNVDEEDEIDEELLGVSDDEEIPLPEESRADEGEGGADASRPLSYGNEDIEVSVGEFQPSRPPGPHLGERVTRLGAGAFTRAIDFFELFFTEQMMQMLCDHTNLYGWLNILEKPTYARKSDGAWSEVEVSEMRRFLALVIMMGFIVLPDLARYWSQASLYAGGWSPRIMSRNRFKALLAMLHVSNPDEEDKADKLTKIRPLLNHMKDSCLKWYQPDKNISVDERMVCSKGRSGIRQFMPNKPVRFGYKLWCACEAGSGYTIGFNVYTGRREKPSKFGLAYDVVTELLAPFQQQNYRVYMDNYYTSLPLVKDLLDRGIYACGTTLPRRRGFPEALKDQAWAKKATRGQMRYQRDGKVLCVQWKDNRPVCVCSTLHRGHEFTYVQRRLKGSDGTSKLIFVRKPQAIHDYNMNMGGVDLADQMIQNYNVLLKSARWWKTIFFHLVDVAILNAFILFKKWQQLHPDLVQLHRPACYSHLHFREELVRQLAQLHESEPLTMKPTHASQNRPAAVYHTDHVPEYNATRRNCRVCYLTSAQEVKTNWRCVHDACDVYLCLNKDRNCFDTWHSPSFDHIREGKYRHTH